MQGTRLLDGVVAAFGVAIDYPGWSSVITAVMLGGTLVVEGERP